MAEPGRLKHQSQMLVVGQQVGGVIRKGVGGDNRVKVDGGSTNAADTRGGRREQVRRRNILRSVGRAGRGLWCETDSQASKGGVEGLGGGGGDVVVVQDGVFVGGVVRLA